MRTDDDLIEVDQIKGRGDAAQLGGITLYERDRGSLRAIVTAPRGWRSGDGWAIGPARRFDVATGKITQVGQMVIARGVTGRRDLSSC